MKLSRISKLFVDRDAMTVATALVQRQEFLVTMSCGEDVAKSYTLQLAVLTAVNIAMRCFPGGVRVAIPETLMKAPLLLWCGLKQTFGQAIIDLAGTEARIPPDKHEGRVILFGNAPSCQGALRVTFDGWIAKVGPATQVDRLQERQYCSLAGILGASLAMSELFMSFAELNITACRRTVALSLWRPGADVSDPSSLGIPIQFLPKELWILGLGHLGNAYLWALGSLPYDNPREVEFFLNDYDEIEEENIETSLLFAKKDIEEYKTRASSAWLEARKFRTRLIERPFDANFRRRDEEPGMALCGFDSNEVRRNLATAKFLRVVESGLGGTHDNFDTVSLHMFPNPRPISELWPDLTAEQNIKTQQRQERLSQENEAYKNITDDACGRYELAGKSIAVPFVGATAAVLVVAEVLRLMHLGPAYTGIKLSMSSYKIFPSQALDTYEARDFKGLGYSLVHDQWNT